MQLGTGVVARYISWAGLGSRTFAVGMCSAEVCVWVWVGGVAWGNKCYVQTAWINGRPTGFQGVRSRAILFGSVC